MLSIKNNLMAESAARQLSKNYDNLATSVERLSSGLRINSAKDDAAGLAVRELMRADIAVIKQGARNARDGISMLQTMEGAMGTIDDALIRMQELAEQASTGSYSTEQRTIMNNEFVEMKSEIDRIANTTKFNDIAMLNTSAGSVTIHFGKNSSIDVNNVDVKAATLLDSATASISTAATAQATMSLVKTAIETKDTARATFGYKMNRLESTTAVLDIQAENLLSSESRISDVDVASEMANMTKSQVLAQAGIAMLSQANAMPQMALSLIR